jgi:hypothetical protein
MHGKHRIKNPRAQFFGPSFASGAQVLEVFLSNNEESKNEVKQHITEYKEARIEKKVTGKKMQSSKIATLLYSDIFSLRYSGTACAIGYS